MIKVFICGMPGSGKSTLGSSVAKELNIPFYDLDELIETGATRIKDLFAKSESQFRQTEQQTLQTFLTEHQDHSFCLALGGGTISNDRILDLLKRTGVLIFLDVPLSEIATRLGRKTESKKRPLFIDLNSEQINSKLKKIWHLRKAQYWQSHIITGVQDVEQPELLTKRIELFTKFG